MANKERAQKLEKVFDQATTESKLVSLNTEQAQAFVDYMKDESALMREVRTITMDKPNKTIAKMFTNGRFLHPWTKGQVLADSKAQQVSSDTVELSSKLIKGKIIIHDEELEDNIEGTSFTDHLMRIVSRKVANELEEIAIYARSITNPKSALDMFTGFKHRILTGGNVVNSAMSPYTDRKVAKNKFAALMKALKTKYRANTKYFAPSDIVIDYGLLFDTIADSNVRNELRSAILGKPLVEIPLMRNDEPVRADQSNDTTAVNGAVVANGTLADVDVDDASGFQVGDYVTFNYGWLTEKTYRIDAINTNTLTLDRPVEYDIADDATANKVTLDGADVILSNPLNFIYAIQTGQYSMQFESERVAGVGRVYHFKARIDVSMENPEASWIITNLQVVE